MDRRDQLLDLAVASESVIGAARDFGVACRAAGGVDAHGIAANFMLPTIRGQLDQFERLLREQSVCREVPEAVNLARVIEQHSVKVSNSDLAALAALSAILATVASQVRYLLANAELRYLPLIERAFAHLQRQIIADPDGVGASWKRALSGGEGDCERLGGVHLLAHGLWGFKASGPGARTDLVLGGLIESDAEARRTGSPLVLTEWKVATDADCAAKIEAAETQVVLYGEGLLRGFEVHRVRYVVLVSENYLELEPERAFKYGAIRRINIAVSPDTPSKARVRINSAALVPAAAGVDGAALL